MVVRTLSRVSSPLSCLAGPLDHRTRAHGTPSSADFTYGVGARLVSWARLVSHWGKLRGHTSCLAPVVCPADSDASIFVVGHSMARSWLPSKANTVYDDDGARCDARGIGLGHASSRLSHGYRFPLLQIAMTSGVVPRGAARAQLQAQLGLLEVALA